MAQLPNKTHPKHTPQSCKPAPLTLTIAAFSMLYLAPHFITNLKAEDTSRFTMIETEDGIIRLDKQTGAMSSCKNTANSWTCQPITSNQSPNNIQGSTPESASDKEKIATLELENKKLKQRIADLELRSPSGPDDLTDPAYPNEEKRLKLPSEEEVDEAITYMEKMIRKFGGAMKRLQEEKQKEPHTEL